MLTFYVIRQSHTSGHPFYSEFTPHHSGSSSVYTQERPQLQSLHTLTSQLADTRGWGAVAQAEFIPTRSGACALSSPLESVPTQTLATIASKPLTTPLNPLNASLTKNKGGGPTPSSPPASRLPRAFSAKGHPPLPLYPVLVLELDCGQDFDLARDEDFFAALPPKPAVCLIESRAENAEPFLIRTQDLRRRLQ